MLSKKKTIDLSDILTSSERKELTNSKYFKKCSICGKNIYIIGTDEYTYKRRKGNKATKYYCSWGCFRKFDKRKR